MSETSERTKKCGACLAVKPYTAFARRAASPDGLQPRCRECDSRRMAAFRRDNPEVVLDRSLRGRYGIGLEDRKEMLRLQEFRCAICRADDPGWDKGWHVDHCHDTGRVRGITCRACNVGIGILRDSPTILAAALQYLHRSGKCLTTKELGDHLRVLQQDTHTESA